MNTAAAPAVTSAVYAVRAAMIDGSSLDLLLFRDPQSAEAHAAYIRAHCNLLGYDSLAVVERTVIGRQDEGRS
jgi:hypothetical protein